MAVTTWLIDKSAYVRLSLNQVANRDQWNTRISRGLVRLSTITRLELGYSARSGTAGRQQFAVPPLSLMPVEHLTPAIEDRALEVEVDCRILEHDEPLIRKATALLPLRRPLAEDPRGVRHVHPFLKVCAAGDRARWPI